MEYVRLFCIQLGNFYFATLEEAQSVFYSHYTEKERKTVPIWAIIAESEYSHEYISCIYETIKRTFPENKKYSGTLRWRDEVYEARKDTMVVGREVPQWKGNIIIQKQ